MPRVVGTKFTTSWFEADIVGERVINGELVIYLNSDTYKVNRRRPEYWWYVGKAAIIMGKEAIVSLVKRLISTN